MKAGEVKINVDASPMRRARAEAERLAATLSGLIRTDYECPRCGHRYTDAQYDREMHPACGLCKGPLERLTLFVVDRGAA